MSTYRFIKEGRDWYIDLPEYLEQGGSKGDLQMVEGADKMLDMIAKKTDTVYLLIDEKQFHNADMLYLIERCDPYIGGGYYLLPVFEENEVNQKMWLCAVIEFVFGRVPEKIFIKRVER